MRLRDWFVPKNRKNPLFRLEAFGFAPTCVGVGAGLGFALTDDGVGAAFELALTSVGVELAFGLGETGDGVGAAFGLGSPPDGDNFLLESFIANGATVIKESILRLRFVTFLSCGCAGLEDLPTVNARGESKSKESSSGTTELLEPLNRIKPRWLATSRGSCVLNGLLCTFHEVRGPESTSLSFHAKPQEEPIPLKASGAIEPRSVPGLLVGGLDAGEPLDTLDSNSCSSVAFALLSEGLVVETEKVGRFRRISKSEEGLNNKTSSLKLTTFLAGVSLRSGESISLADSGGSAVSFPALLLLLGT